jgi:nucleoside-diphosphate kinase
MLTLSQRAGGAVLRGASRAAVLQGSGALHEFGPVIAQVLEGENAIAKHREIMGATDPKKAAPGTIRADLGAEHRANVVHGSDAPRPRRARSRTSSAPRRSAAR